MTSNSISKYLSTKEIKGFLKLADVIVPGKDNFPKFSTTGYVSKVDNVFEYMSPHDKNDFKMLMGVFCFLPSILIRFLLSLATTHEWWPDIIGTQLRLLDIGTKGVVYTLYYSQKDIQSKIGWSTFIERPVKKAPMTPVEVNVYSESREAAQIIRQIPLKERVKYVSSLKKVIMENEDRILDVVQKEAGKTRNDVYVSEIFATLDHLEYLEKNAEKILSDDSVPTPLALLGKKSKIYYEPVGVVLMVTPWNYPFTMAVVPTISALMAGNAVVHKPSEFTPMKGLMEDLFKLAGIPESWIKIMYGDGAKGAELIERSPIKYSLLDQSRPAAKSWP